MLVKCYRVLVLLVAVELKALGDPNRLKIIKLLTDGEQCACKLLEDFQITQPTLSHHMKILSKYEGVVPCELCFQSIDSLPEGFKCPEGRVKPWGTNHAVLMGKDVIKEPFAVINCDDFYGRDAFMSVGKFLSSLPEGSTNKYARMSLIILLLLYLYFFLCQQPQKACAPKAAPKYLDSFNCICYNHSINCISSKHSCVGG